MEEILQNLTPETIKGTLVLFFGSLAVTPILVAILFKSLEGLKWGLGLGFILAHAAIFVWSPLAIGFFAVEGVIAVLIGVVWLCSVTYRKVTFDGVVESYEKGPGWWFRPETPAAGALRADGERQKLIAEGGTQLLREQRLLEESRHQHRLAELERLLLEEGRHE